MNRTDIDTLFNKIARPTSAYQELASQRKAELHTSRWKLLHEIHAAYQASAHAARLQQSVVE